jgi:hypothetical protein
MAHTALWTEIKPANADNINQGAQEIRNLRRDIRERLELDHVWNIDTSTDGYHNKLTMPDQGGRPSTAVGYSKIWSELSGGVSQPFMKDGSGNIRQLGVPVGTICAYLPGYFANGINGTYTGVSMTLPDGWVLCAGTAPNDALSPIWNTSAKYVPNLTADRFLMGDTDGARGSIGGTNTTTAHTATYPDHIHTVVQPGNHTVTSTNADHTLSVHGVTQPTFSITNHQHRWRYTSTADSINYYDYTYDSSNVAKKMYYANGLPADPNRHASSWNDGTNYSSGFSGGLEDFYTESIGGQTCTPGTASAVADHSALSHSITSIISDHGTISINSTGGGTVSISSNHSTNDNIPVYMSVSYIIKIK